MNMLDYGQLQQQQKFADALRQMDVQNSQSAQTQAGLGINDFKALGKLGQDIGGAFKPNAAQDYASEFGKFDPSFAQTLGKDAAPMSGLGQSMQGLGQSIGNMAAPIGQYLGGLF